MLRPKAPDARTPSSLLVSSWWMHPVVALVFGSAGLNSSTPLVAQVSSSCVVAASRLLDRRLSKGGHPHGPSTNGRIPIELLKHLEF